MDEGVEITTTFWLQGQLIIGDCYIFPIFERYSLKGKKDIFFYDGYTALFQYSY